MKIALLGYGTVGRSLDELLQERQIGIEVTRILRRPGKTVGDARMTDSIDAVLSDPSIDAVVEVLSGEMPAACYIEAALRTGKHVVTANKAAIAPRMKQLLDTANAHGVQLAFEASAGGVVPWIANLRRSAAFDQIDRFTGILNGTGNYIIDRMLMGDEFSEALADAQAKGYAEADPTADIGGFDLANKALVTAAAAFSLVPNSTDYIVPKIGLEGLSLDYLRNAAREGKTVRFMAFGRAKKQHGEQPTTFTLGAAPVLLSTDALEAGVRRNYNLATFWGDVSGPLAFFGQGAGGRPTADAIIADLLDIQATINTSVRHRISQSSLTEAEEDESLLFGTGVFADGTRKTDTFAALARDASKHRLKHGFMAFEPDPSLFVR